jgi:DNA-binding transcriptional MocR family regulator
MTGAWRQEWAQALRSARGLSMTARMVGQVLALDFANAATGQCNPSRATLARHLEVSEATIKRALNELIKAGWLSRSTATARNRMASYTFLSPGKVVAFDTAKPKNAGHARPAMQGGTRVKSAPNAGQICTPPYKGRNQVKNQSARATATGGGWVRR